MPIQSMTGFARIEGFNEIANWTWEVRSLNGKGLDFRLRIPSGNDALQPQIRKLIASHLLMLLLVSGMVFQSLDQGNKRSPYFLNKCLNMHLYPFV